MSKAKVWVIARVEPDGKPMKIYGREAWTLKRLIEAGKRGVTPVDRPAPRWSAYVHDLRTNFGLTIETEHEPHAGSFPGSHARYRLHSPVRIIEDSEGEMTGRAAA